MPAQGHAHATLALGAKPWCSRLNLVARSRTSALNVQGHISSRSALGRTSSLAGERHRSRNLWGLAPCIFVVIVVKLLIAAHTLATLGDAQALDSAHVTPCRRRPPLRCSRPSSPLPAGRRLAPFLFPSRFRPGAVGRPVFLRSIKWRPTR